MKGMCLQILGFCSLFLTNPIKCHVIHKRSDLHTIPAPSEFPIPLPLGWPGGCFYQGTWYPLDSEISSQRNEEEGWCSGLHCDTAGNVVSWETPDCYPTPAPTKIPMTTPPSGCFYEGKWYAPSTDISQGSDGRGWCYGAICDYDGHVTFWDTFNCLTTKKTTVPLLPTTTPPPTTTSPPITTIPPGCFHGGKWYAPGTDISQGSDGDGWCYGTYCDADGDVISWDDWNCLPTTKETMPPPSTTPPRTTLPDTTIPWQHQGCFHRGKWYAPGDKVSQGSDGNGWCYGLYCDANGNLIPWDDWNCQSDKTTPQETTRTTTNEATTEEMTTKETTTTEETTTAQKTTTKKTTTNETTTEETTISPDYPTTLPDTTVLTTQEGCYNNGIWYPLNSQISLVKSGQMCFGFLCDHAGSIVPKMCTKCGSILDCP